MASEAKILRFPIPEELVVCRLKIPRFSEIIELEEDAPSGMAAMAVEYQRIAERFDELAQLFDEYPEAKYCTDTLYVEGHLTFEFYVPRRCLNRLKQLGWTPQPPASVEGDRS
jgi:hypothetical protein